MRPQTISLTASGDSDALFPDSQQVAFTLGLQVDYLDGATGAASVQATMADPRDPGFSGEWFDVTDLDTIAAPGTQGNIVIPVFAVRLQRDTSGGTVRLTMLQTRNN